VGRCAPIFVIVIVLYMVGYLRLSVVWAVLGCGVVSYIWARRCLKARSAKQKAHQ
jgi:hypothetical protein